MAKHTAEEMEKLPFDELKKHAAEEAVVESTATTKEPDVDEPEEFIARRELDMGEGAGLEVFEATGATREEALEALTDKIAESKLNASKKIRQQEAELRDFRARTAEPAKPKEISADDEYVIAQELQKNPSKAFRKMFKELTGYEVEDFSSVKQAYDAYKVGQQANQGIATFIATHSDYEDAGKAGERNAELMKMKLAEMGLPGTSENLSKAYSHLKQSGLLTLKGEEAHADTDDKTKEPERIAQAKVEPTQQRTKKTSGISTQSSRAVAPASTEPSEDDAYKLPMDQLLQLANKQMSAR